MVLYVLKGVDTCSRETNTKLFLAPFWKWVYSKNQEIAPLFQRELGVQEIKQEVTRVVSLINMAEYLPNVSLSSLFAWLV